MFLNDLRSMTKKNRLSSGDKVTLGVSIYLLELGEGCKLMREIRVMTCSWWLELGARLGSSSPTFVI